MRFSTSIVDTRDGSVVSMAGYEGVKLIQFQLDKKCTKQCQQVFVNVSLQTARLCGLD